MLKRILALLLAATLAVGCLSFALADSRVQIVVTTFPLYDWARVIAGDEADIVFLQDNGVDLHNYQPTAQDIMKIATCDLFIYIGGESDDWVEDALATAVNPNRRALCLMEALGEQALEEELVEGMEDDHDHDDHDDDDHDNHDDHDDSDEHIWLSLRNARVLTAAIADALCALRPAGAEAYRARQAAYAQELDALDAAYTEAVNRAPLRTVLFGDRFPFRYLTHDYGLSYYAAFSGCSAETEASFQTIAFLSGKLNELSLPAVLTIEGTDHRIAETIIQSSQAKNQKLLTLNSMQGATLRDAQSGMTYLGVMESNLPVLTEALGLEMN